MSESPPRTETTMERRLAAIMFTDVVGYSARMQRDEPGTLALVHADFSAMRELCVANGGEVLNAMGDGLLLCFPSASQAVACALQIQARFGERKARVPAEQALEHRVGVHIGDVVRQQAGGVAGDGVNIAARLQTKAPPGGICISQMVHDTVKGKLPMQAVFIGPESFKNITEPIPVYHIAPEGAPPPVARAAAGKRSGFPRWLLVSGIAAITIAAGGFVFFGPKESAERAAAAVAERKPVAPPSAVSDQSVVVLPLENFSPDPENAFFTDGMHSEIIATLSRLADLKVISRTSALAFKGATVPLHEIGTRLAVAHAISGSVRRAGNRVRIQLELRRARDEALLWSQTYDRELSDVFTVQSEVAGEVARVLQAREARGSSAGAQFLTREPRAYDLFLRARTLTQQADFIRHTNDAIALLEQALALDPQFMPAARDLSIAHTVAYVFAETDPAARLQHAAAAKRWGEAASNLAPGGAGDAALAYYHTMIEGSPRSVTLAENAVRALPNDATNHQFLEAALNRLGRPAEALVPLRRALELDPVNAVYWREMVFLLGSLRRADEAEQAIERYLGVAAGREDRGLIAFVRHRLSGALPADLTGMPLTDRLAWLWAGRRFEELAAAVESELAAGGGNDVDRFGLLIRRAAVAQRLGRADAGDAAREALAQSEKLRAVPEVDRSLNDWRMARALALLGRGDEAVAAARRYVEAVSPTDQTSTRWTREVELAALYAQLGRNAESIGLLRRLLLVPSGITLPAIGASPDWDGLREDNAFKELAADAKFSVSL